MYKSVDSSAGFSRHVFAKLILSAPLPEASAYTYISTCISLRFTPVDHRDKGRSPCTRLPHTPRPTCFSASHFPDYCYFTAIPWALDTGNGQVLLVHLRRFLYFNISIEENLRARQYTSTADQWSPVFGPIGRLDLKTMILKTGRSPRRLPQ